MQSYKYEGVEILESGPLLVSVDATRYENPVKSLIREKAKFIMIEEIQHKVSDYKYSADCNEDRTDMLYQALISGDNLLELKREIVNLVKSIRLLEKCYIKKITEGEIKHV